MDWGVDRKPKRFSIGTKLGLLAVTVVLAGFGYVLYRKVEQNKALGHGFLAAGEEPPVTSEEPPVSDLNQTPPITAQSEPSSPLPFEPVNPRPIQQVGHEVSAPESEASETPESAVSVSASTEFFPAETVPAPKQDAQEPIEFEPAVPVETKTPNWASAPSTTPTPVPTVDTTPQPTMADATPVTVEDPFGGGEVSNPPNTGKIELVGGESAPASIEFAASETPEPPEVMEAAVSPSNGEVETSASPFGGNSEPSVSVPPAPINEPIAVPSPMAEANEPSAPVFSEPPVNAPAASTTGPGTFEPTAETPAGFADADPFATTVPTAPKASVEGPTEASVEMSAAPPAPGETVETPAVFESESPFGETDPAGTMAPVPNATTEEPLPPAFTNNTATKEDRPDPFAADVLSPQEPNVEAVQPTASVPVQTVEPNLEPVPTAMEEPATEAVPFSESTPVEEPVPFAKTVPFEASQPVPTPATIPNETEVPAASPDRATAELFGPVDAPVTSASEAPAMIDVPPPSPNGIQQTFGNGEGTTKNAFEAENPFTADTPTPVDQFATDPSDSAEANNAGTPAAQMSSQYEPELIPVPSSETSNVFEPNAPAFEADEIDVYEVRPRDNYWTISKTVYGTGRYFTALARFNRSRIPDPKKMRPGMKVLVPTREALEQANPDLFPKRVLNTDPAGADSGFFMDENGTPRFRVGKEDTLGSIAHAHLGRFSRWTEIYQLNRQRLNDPNKLTPGTELQLPQDASRVRVVSAEVMSR